MRSFQGAVCSCSLLDSSLLADLSYPCVCSSLRMCSEKQSLVERIGEWFVMLYCYVFKRWDMKYFAQQRVWGKSFIITSSCFSCTAGQRLSWVPPFIPVLLRRHVWASILAPWHSIHCLRVPSPAHAHLFITVARISSIFCPLIAEFLFLSFCFMPNIILSLLSLFQRV